MVFCPPNVSAPPAACLRLKCSVAAFSAASHARLFSPRFCFRGADTPVCAPVLALAFVTTSIRAAPSAVGASEDSPARKGWDHDR
jgi:hypothetical protein